MEEDQEVKQHVCKFCSKCFPCGRSLGGHMRSHVIVTSETEEKIGNCSTTMKKKVSSLSNKKGGGDGGYYGLREKPKKTWRLKDHSGEEDSLVVLDKLCKECGKGFHSWKALFGHMKCHSEKDRERERERERESQNNNTFNLDDQDSWTSQKMVVLDTQSDNEATAPNRRTRSKRRRTRYITPSTTSSLSFVSEAQEQEQEEVAMSLMMLSRDVTPWCGFNSVSPSSLNNSLHFQPPSNLISKVEGNNNKRLIFNASQMPIKVTKPSEFPNSVASNLTSKGKKSSQFFTTESPGNGFEVKRTKVLIDGKDRKPELDSQFEHHGTENNSNNKYTSIKAKFLDSELKSSSFKSWGNKNSEAEFSKNSHHNKRGKFECTTCNKVFHSYQALGGHRASHKKIKGCFASKNENSENSTELLEAEFSPADPTTTKSSKLRKNNNTVDNHNEYVEEHEMVTISTATAFGNEVDTVRESKKIEGHECPICFKVFPSGQALGGHKRSHLAGGSESTRNSLSQRAVLEEATPEIRDLFDLNLPATTEEESNSHDHDHAEPYRPWWVVGGNPKQEALVGLMSNY